MNHVYRLVWNASLRAFVPAAEWTKARGKSGGRTRKVRALLASAILSQGAATLATAGPAPPSPTLPTGGKVTAGSATLSGTATTLTVDQSSNRAAIDWNSFSIGSGGTVTFEQPSTSAVTLNRVTGNETSVIDGALKANGQVFILNSNGVLFNKDARIDTGGLVASTLNLSDADFMAGRTTFTAAGHGSIINLGKITAADGGYVALLGNQVRNDGVIVARLGTVALAAGNKISLNFNGNSLLGVTIDTEALNGLVANNQAIIADGGLVILTAQGLDAALAGVVNNTGEIRAQTVGERDGKIYLLGDLANGGVNVAGTLDASAPNGGDGGYIETSAATVKVATGARVTTAAANGLTGSWLIDPTDFNIAASGGDITGAQLSSELASSNISLSSTNGAAGSSGNLNVNDVVSWSANKLTLTAVNAVNINAVMTATGNASLDLEPGSGAVNVALGSSGFTGGVNFSAGGTLTINNLAYTVINALGTASSSGDGTLQGMQGNLAGHYALGSNIDASATSSWNSGAGFASIGSASIRFSGSFDGLGHTISNLTIDATLGSGVGLFGGMASPAVVRNVGLTGAVVTGNYWVGALVGDKSSGTISNTYSNGSVTGAQYTGGLVGANYGTLTNSHASGTVTSIDGNSLGDLNSGTFTGGLVGQNGGTISNSYASTAVSGIQTSGGLVGVNLATISNSYATGAVGESGFNTGGLAGINYGSVTGSYATGNVTAPANNTGGLVGHNAGSVSGSHATGNVSSSGSDDIGGLVGFNDNGGHISASYATGNVSGDSFVGGLVGYNYANVTTSHATGAVTGGGSDIGGLVGTNYGGGSISQSYATGAVNASNASQVGGLVGFNYSGATIDTSYATGAVHGNSNVGGLVGLNYGSVSTAFASGGVVAAGRYAGGLVGANQSGATITNAYATGSVTSSSIYVGGLAGENNGTISDTYATGTMTGAGYTGALVGYNGGAVTGSFWNSTTSGSVPGIDGGDTSGATGMNTANLMTRANYTSATAANGSNNPAWDMTSTWTMYEGLTNPLLQTFMTPLTISVAGSGKIYDGTTSLPVTYSVTPNLSHLFGTLIANTSSPNVGTYTVTPSGQYSDQLGYMVTYVSNTAPITARPIAVTTVSGATRQYDGTTDAATGLLTITNVVNGDIVTLSGDGTLASRNAGGEALTSVGSLAVNNTNYTVTGASLGGSVAITPRPIDVTPVSGASQTYSGSTAVSPNLLSVTNLITGDSLTLGGSASLSGSNAGTESLASLGGLTLSNPNYTLVGGAVTGNVTVTPRTVTLTNVNGASQVYNGSASAPANLLVITNVVTGDSVTLSGNVTLAAASAGSENVVSLSGLTLNNPNYTLASATPSGSVTISPRPVSVAAVNGATEVYNGTSAAPADLLTITNVLNNDTVTLSGNATLAGSNAGTESLASLGGLTLSNPNYTLVGGAVTGNVTVTPRTVTLTNVNGASQVYNGSASAPANLLVITNVVTGDSVTLSGNVTLAAASAGSENVVSLSGLTLNNPNYTLASATPSGSVTISPRPVSVAAVNGATEVYNGTSAAPADLLTITNVLNNDTVTLSGNATLAGSGAGSQRVVSLSGLTLNNPNYTLESGAPSGSVTITPRPVSVAAVNGATKVYNGTTAAPADLLTITNVLTGDTVTLSGSATLAGSGTGLEGILSLLGLTLNNPNYTLVSGTPSGSVLITPRPATVAAIGGATEVYNGRSTAPADLLTITNVVNGDSVSLAGDATLASSAVGTEALVSLSGLTLSNSNYELVGGAVSGSVLITPAAGSQPTSPSPFLENAIATADDTAQGSSVSPTQALAASVPNVVYRPGSLGATFAADTPLAVVSAPSGKEPTAIVSLSQASQMLSPATFGGDGSTTDSPDVRVPVSRNSLAEIVNGGVKLPTGVEQQLFVVRAN